ncbi:MAG: lysophospholipid acyltransferase family protein, partial [Myxococcales bacterium]|nr:lysophospholipid acyltransferase family protein [Myxococcales bacterium]
MNETARVSSPAIAATWAECVVSAALWAAGVSFLVPTLSTLMLLQLVVPADRLEWLNRFYCWGQIALTGSRWKAVVDPAVDPRRPYIFCQNHTNHFDHCVGYRATPHFKQGLERIDHFRYPFYGWFMRQRGTIPVDPRRREAFRRELDRGHSILAFPEGTRTRDGRVGPFRLGVFRVARDLGVPVVPMAVTGMYAVMRADSWIIRPGHEVTVWVDAPIETRDVPVEAVRELA